MDLEITIANFEPPNASQWAAATQTQRRDWYRLAGKHAVDVLRERLLGGRDRHGKKMLKRLRERADGADGAPLSPHGEASRTVANLRFRSDAESVTLYWVDGWGEVLRHHQQGIKSRRGRRVRDVGGFTSRERKDIYNRALDEWIGPTVAVIAPIAPPTPELQARPQRQPRAARAPRAPRATRTSTPTPTSPASLPAATVEPPKSEEITVAVLPVIGIPTDADVERLKAEYNAASAKWRSAGKAKKPALKALAEAAQERWVAAEQARYNAAKRTLPDSVDDIVAFADAVKRLASSAPASHRFGDNKVFIHRVHQTWVREIGQVSLDQFKRRLGEASQRLLIQLSRADLVEAMNPADVEASNMTFFGATFNFVVDPLTS